MRKHQHSNFTHPILKNTLKTSDILRAMSETPKMSDQGLHYLLTGIYIKNEKSLKIKAITANTFDKAIACTLLLENKS